MVLCSWVLGCAGKPTRASSGSSVQQAEAELRVLEDTWADAYVTHDASALAPVLADDFVMSRASSEMWSKEDYLEHVRRDTRRHVSITRADERYRVYGDAAVVTYRPTRLTNDTAYTFRSTDTFIRRNGKWQLVARHITEVPRRRP